MLDYIYSISPIDGRYSEMTKEVGNYFSEYHLIKNRIIVEIEWLKKLAKIEELNIQLTKKELEILNKIEIPKPKNKLWVRKYMINGFSFILSPQILSLSYLFLNLNRRQIFA